MDRKLYVVILHYLPSTDFPKQLTASKRLSRNKHLWSINVCTKGPPEQFPNQKPGFLEVYVAANVSSDQIGQPRSELILGEEQRLNRKKKKLVR